MFLNMFLPYTLFWEISSIFLVSYILDFRFHLYIDSSQIQIFQPECEKWILLPVDIYLDIPQASQDHMNKTPFSSAPPSFSPLLKGKKSPQLASLYFLSQVSSINTVLLVRNVVISDFSPFIHLTAIAGFQVFLLYLIWLCTVKGVLIKNFGINKQDYR